MIGSAANASVTPSNAGLNRYKNIVAYDATRATIKKNSANKNNDYINANWVPGHQRARGYLATQGPVPDSFNAHWQLVWESGIETIVMVTNEIENNALKCHRYWPSKEEGAVKYGEITVTLLSEEPTGTYIVRRMKVTRGGGSFELLHFQYTVWPDHGVPNTTSEILTFRKAVRKANPWTGPPLLVHCSAGVGRTGTFIVIDTMHNRAATLDSDLDIHGFVKKIRCSRNYLVQTLVQYQFCFRACLDALNKSLVKCVKQVRKLGEGSEDTALNALGELGDIETDISEALDAYGGVDHADALLTLGRKAGRGIIADKRWAAFDADNDKAVAKKVSKSTRKKSLEKATDLWKVRGNVPNYDEEGYFDSNAPGLPDRVKSLAINSGPEAWRSKYSEVAQAWVAEVYDVTSALNPIESRLMSLASQTENWKLRGQVFRAAIEKDGENVLSDLTQRMDSLRKVLDENESRWRSKTNIVTEVTSDASLAQRLESLADFSTHWQNRGTGEGKIVESPQKRLAEEQALRRAEQDALRQIAAAELEAKQLAEKAERLKLAEERRRKAEPPVKPTPSNFEPKVKKMVELRPTEKEEEAHPMVKAAATLSKKKK